MVSRFYSPILLSEAGAADQRGRRPRPFSGPSPSAMRPCARSRRRGDARTGTDGGVRRPRLHARSGPFCPLTCGVQVAFLLSPSSSPPGSGTVSLLPICPFCPRDCSMVARVFPDCSARLSNPGPYGEADAVCPRFQPRGHRQHRPHDRLSSTAKRPPSTSPNSHKTPPRTGC